MYGEIYRGVMCHNNEEWCKIWRGIEFSVQNWHEELDEFWPKHLKISKTWTLMDCFWPKHIIFELKKGREELCLMALNIDANFGGKLTCAFKNVMRNLADFHQITFKSLKIGTLMGCFYPKTYELSNLRIVNQALGNLKKGTFIGCFWPTYIMFKLKKYRGVMFDDTEYWYKIWRNTDLCFLKWREEFGKLSFKGWKIVVLF